MLAEPHGTQMRFRPLETIRQYGRERLAETGEEQAMRWRHRDFYLELAQAEHRLGQRLVAAAGD